MEDPLTSRGIHSPPSPLAQSGDNPSEATLYHLRRNTFESYHPSREDHNMSHLEDTQVSNFSISRGSLYTNLERQKRDL